MTRWSRTLVLSLLYTLILPLVTKAQTPEAFNATGSLATARYEHTATLLGNGTVLIAGGWNTTTTFSSAELYHPSTGTFSTTGSMVVARNSHTATLLNNGTVLITGGLNTGTTSSAELYNPSTGTFSATGSMTFARYLHTATPLRNGTVLVAGGALPNADLYNPSTGTFTATGSMITARLYATATLLNNGMVLLAGGQSGSSSLASAELYDPSTGTFTATGSMTTARRWHTATLLNNGTVLIAGGFNTSVGYLASAELYNPVTGTFTATGSIPTAFGLHTATLLNNGMALLAGGHNASTILASAVLYNPSTGIFSSTGSMNASRYSHTATLLSNGSVLVAGGLNTSNVSPVNASAESYQLTPVTPVIGGISPISGPIGSAVTVAGSNFGATQGTSTLKFNGTAAAPASWSDTSIVANVPTGATTGPLIVTVAGIASNSIAFTVTTGSGGSSTPSITSLSPTSGPAGTTLVIQGANFGALQGSSTVSISGTVAAPLKWGSTSIVAQVPIGASSGNVLVTVQGVQSNGTNFTVIPSPAISQLSNASGTVGSSVVIQGANFGATQGTSVVSFNGTVAQVISWSSQNITASVPTGAQSGPVSVTVSGIRSNSIPFSVTTTAPRITSLSPASGRGGTQVTLQGANFGTSVGTVTFNGSVATILSWSPTSISTDTPSWVTTGPVLVTANGATSNPVTFTVFSATPTLFVNPSKINLLVGQTQNIQLLDQNGTIISSPTWTTGNSSVAAIVPPVSQGGSTSVQGISAGSTTITGRSPDGRVAVAQITVWAGTSLPIGTIKWQAPSLGGSTGPAYGITRILQSLPVDDTAPDLYVEDTGSDGTLGMIRALSSDGQQIWSYRPATPAEILATDDKGGTIIEYRSSDGINSTLARLDDVGNLTWTYDLTIGISGVAIHQDGTVYFVRNDFNNNDISLVGLDGATGGTKFTFLLPKGNFTLVNGLVGQHQISCSPGSVSTQVRGNGGDRISISSDGVVYYPFGVETTLWDFEPCVPPFVPSGGGSGTITTTSSLFLLAVNPDGTTTTTLLDTGSRTLAWNQVSPNKLLPGEGLLGYPTPDGTGGVLLVAGSDYSGNGLLYHASSSGVSKLNLPTLPEAQYPAEILLGEDGTAFVGGVTLPLLSPYITAANLLSIDVQSNTIKWNDSLPNPYFFNLFAVPAAGGIVFEDPSGHLNVTDASGVISPLFPASNGGDAGPTKTKNLTYWTLGTWLASMNDGSIVAINGENTFIAASQRSVPGGSVKNDSKPGLPKVVDFLPSFIEVTTGGTPNTQGFPCFQDAVSATSLKNVLRNYTQNPCGNSPSPGSVSRVEQRYRLRSDATAQSFRNDLSKPVHALAFIGHSSIVHLNQPSEFSIGIEFYYPVAPGKNPGDVDSWDTGYTAPGNPPGLQILTPECAPPDNFCNNTSSPILNKLLPFEKNVTTVVGLSTAWTYGNSAVTSANAPGPPHAPILLANKIGQQARVLFFGACALTPKSALSDEVPVFLQMWDINDARFGTPEAPDRAIILPDGSSIANFDANTTDLAYAAAMWNKILFDLVKLKKTVGDAVKDANQTITPTWPNVPNGSIQPTFMVLGNPNVKLN